MRVRKTLKRKRSRRSVFQPHQSELEHQYDGYLWDYDRGWPKSFLSNEPGSEGAAVTMDPNRGNEQGLGGADLSLPTHQTILEGDVYHEV